MDTDSNTRARKLTEEVNSKRGPGGEWPASFDYTIEPEKITLKANRKLNKSGYRCLDSWGMALFHHVKTRNMNIKAISLVINKNGRSWTPDMESLKRRVSFLDINNEDIDFTVEYHNRRVGLYGQKALFERPDTEVIRDSLNQRGDNDKGRFLEKSFQAFLFGKGLEKESRTNDRLAILGEHFFQLKKKGYGVLREFPTGAYLKSKSRRNRITPTDFVDIVTLNRWGNLSVIELKLDDPKLEVMSQLLDYALFFCCYKTKILKLLEKEGSNLRPRKGDIMCYVVNNRFHKRFDDIFQYYRTKKSHPFGFQMFKVVLGHTTP